MKQFIKWVPELYPLFLIVVYAVPDFPILFGFCLLPVLGLLFFNWSWLRIAVGIFFALLNVLFCLAWISELSEFPSLFMAWKLILGGLLLMSTHGYMAWYFISKPHPGVGFETIAGTHKKQRGPICL